MFLSFLRLWTIMKLEVDMENKEKYFYISLIKLMIV